jgi:hypothetical protein
MDSTDLQYRIDTGRITYRKMKSKGRILKKKDGPEMQHCPFCMAAWLVESEAARKKECKFCGAGLG